MTVFCSFPENFRNLVRRIFAFFDILTHFLQYIRVDREKCRKMAKSAQKSASIQPIFWYFESKNDFWYFGDILVLWPSPKSKWKCKYFDLKICSQCSREEAKELPLRSRDRKSHPIPGREICRRHFWCKTYGFQYSQLPISPPDVLSTYNVTWPGKTEMIVQC